MAEYAHTALMAGDRRLVYSTETGPLRERKKGASGSKKRRGAQASGCRVRRERKGRAGKMVTIVEGLPLEGVGMQAWLKRVKSRLGTGGTVKDDHIEIQGDHCETLLDQLRHEGIPAKRSGG